MMKDWHLPDNWQNSFESHTHQYDDYFLRSETREKATLYVRGILADVERKNGWQLSETLGLSDPHRLQRLLNEAKWDADVVQKQQRTQVVAVLDDKSNEITAIPELLDLLYVKGCIVTIDAMGCQKKIANKIIAQQADYVLSVKDNQKNLHQDLQDWLAYADKIQFKDLRHDYHKVVPKGHGRLEIRECWVIDDPIAFEHIRYYDGWTGLNAIVRVRRERRIHDQIQSETVYYITSLEPDAERILTATRLHWSIENQLHWVMDVTFNEDQMRTRQGHSAQNLIVLRNMALNILKQDTSKGSLRQKRYRAALDETFLEQLLVNI